MAGRGKLLRQFLQATGESGSEEGSGPKVDSGLDTNSPSMTIRSQGRGQILEYNISNSSSSDGAAGLQVAGRGRALLEKIGRGSSDGANVVGGGEDSDSAVGSVIGSLPPPGSSGRGGGIGRGNFFKCLQMMENISIEKKDTSVETTNVSVEHTQESSKDEAFSSMEVSIREEAPKEPVIKMGKAGITKPAACNYIRLKNLNENVGIYEYEVRFNPVIDGRNIRFNLLNQQQNVIGKTKIFDGVVLFLPIRLPDNVTILTSKNSGDDSDVSVKIIYKRKKPMKDCMQFYNILFDRIMKVLNYVRFDRKQYDPTAPKHIPQHKLEIWPGYVTAVDEYEDGLMLCCDVSHRVLCENTVYDILIEAYHSAGAQYQEQAKKAIIGCIVITRYNNRTYRIDDIDFDSSPLSTFKQGDRMVSYKEYYKQHYNIDIKDSKQPLLTSIKVTRIAGKDEPIEMTFSIIPEICHLTGLTDKMRSDFKLMREIASFTRVTPNQRMLALQQFNENVNKNKAAKEILNNWGLQLCPRPENLQGRLLPEEKVTFKCKEFPVGPNADFSRYCTNNELLEVVPLSNWLLIHTRNDGRTAKTFIDLMSKNCKPMGLTMNMPRIVQIDNDQIVSFVNALRSNIKAGVQIVVIICPTSRDDRYAAIKKVCCVESPIPSQVINAKTLANDSKNRSIVQKIALQMNCKLGGTLWSIKIPFSNVMICGVDTFHEAGNRGNSVAGFVASLNGAYTKWYSKSVIQNKKEELVNGLCTSLHMALMTYKKMNDKLPDKIIIFRDGVGDGQLKFVDEYEIPQLEEACKQSDPNYNPLFTFIVVQKRINTRIFMESGNEHKNPDPGYIIDHKITRRYLYDFFLIAQSVRQGTVSPAHYIVLKDSNNFPPDTLQRLSYKLCFLYYNWPGTVRVPACCQYAHKLCTLVGQSIKRETSESLANKLFYL
ncbi:PIWIL2 family protein [Megaselia abdita]